MSKKPQQKIFVGRRVVLLTIIGIAMSFLMVRAIDLQLLNSESLQKEGLARHLKFETVSAHRGMITDRNGSPLAISTPVDSVWAHPGKVLIAIKDSGVKKQFGQLAQLINEDPTRLLQWLTKRSKRQFEYLKRRVSPDLAQQIMQLNINGVALKREYRRFYPTGEVSAHVIGYTDIDDKGQEGIELEFNDWLHGVDGKKRVIKDARGRTVKHIGYIKRPVAGKALVLSIDQRIQYLAYRELKKAMGLHNAKSGCVVIVDIQSGEVLAMVNQPSHNPNKRLKLRPSNRRNRAVTDVLEPGSTIKPFIVAAALATGRFHSGTVIDTNPGYFRIGGKTIRDAHKNHGKIDVTTVLQKSSNVGASKIALSIEPEKIWQMLDQVGLGKHTGSEFPGERNGSLKHFSEWREIDRATLAYGYGLSVTPLQLARAYAALAGNGRPPVLSFLRSDYRDDLQPAYRSYMEEAQIDPQIVTQLRYMLETVTLSGGTGTKAQVQGYRIAGKTGTVKKSGRGGYKEHSYVALFAGVAPATHPRLVMVVVIDEPSKDEYYGGLVAAPVFSAIMSGALRIVGVTPDNLDDKQFLDNKIASAVGHF